MNCFEIFKECFPFFEFDEKIFNTLSGIADCRIFIRERDGEAAAFGAVQGNNIRLLCVLPQYRGQGIGGSLLGEMEEHISSQGFDRAEIGGVSSELFIGAVSESADFFEKRGYVLSGNIAEMLLDTDNFSPDTLPLNVPDGVSFGYYNGSHAELENAVARVEEDWVRYFPSNENVFCGFCGGKIASFCNTDGSAVCMLSGEGKTVGSIGCVGTLPEYRRRGIGLKMTALAAYELKKRGCRRIFIHYTHVYDWYARLGAKPFLFVRLGGKELRS